MIKSLQMFSQDQLLLGSKMTAEEIINFIEDFRNVVCESSSGPSKLISMKVPEGLLRTFKVAANQHNIPYQTLIKKLMIDWLKELSGNES